MKKWQSYQNVSVNKKPRKSSLLRKKRISEFVSPLDLVLDIGAFAETQLKFLNLKNSAQYFPADINKFTPRTIVVDITKDCLPFEDGFFDKIIFSMVLEHLDTPLPALKEIKRVLKKEGHLILIVPNGENIIKIFASILSEKKYIKAEKPEHCIGFGTQEICALLKRASFRVTHFEKRSPEISTLNLKFPEWRIFKPFTSDILVVAKKIIE